MSETTPCSLVTLRVDDDGVLLLLRVSNREVPVPVPLDRRTIHLIKHRHAGFDHPSRCTEAAVDRGSVPLLLRTFEAAGGRAPWLLVRAGREPAFWLAGWTLRGPIELDLDIPDVVTLALADRIPLALVGEIPDWDGALVALAGDEAGGDLRE